MSFDRHPRTLQEAFGPYTSGRIEEEKRCFFRELWRLIRRKA